MSPLHPHQAAGARRIVEQETLLLGDEMRVGKTRTVIAAAEELFRRGVIDRVVVIAPKTPAHDTWFSLEFGQLAAFSTQPVTVLEYRASGAPKRWLCANCHEDKTRVDLLGRRLPRSTTGEPALPWLVTNYELVRSAKRRAFVEEWIGVLGKTLLVLDESIAVAGHSSQQTRAVFKIRQRCARVVELNGTPWGDKPGALYSQMKILDPAILGCTTWYEFVARYGMMGGFRALKKVKQPDGSWRKQLAPTQIVRWVNLDDLSRRTAPYVLRRTMAEVYPDMPKALEPAVISASLTPSAWSLYSQMKKDAVAYLQEGVVTAAQAGVKMLRLRQITAGFLGGVDDVSTPREIGREKQDAVREWFKARLDEQPGFKAIFWCAFRAEAERLAAELGRLAQTRLLYGQDDASRQEALRLLDPRTAPEAAAALVGLPQTGGFGLDFSAADAMVYVTNHPSLVIRQQSEARIIAATRTSSAVYLDVLAEGPAGQRTVDHAILKALRGKRDVASLTAAEWIKEIE